MENLNQTKGGLLSLEFIKIAFLYCKYGVRRLYLVLTTPATPLNNAYQCGFFYV